MNAGAYPVPDDDLTHELSWQTNWKPDAEVVQLFKYNKKLCEANVSFKENIKLLWYKCSAQN